jgi:hypothetical protein
MELLYNNPVTKPLAWRSPDRKVTSVQWPAAVDAHLDLLLSRCIDAGENTSRSQILAALVTGAPLDGEALGVIVRNYRRLSIDQFVAPASDGYPPGPRQFGAQAKSLAED